MTRSSAGDHVSLPLEVGNRGKNSHRFFCLTPFVFYWVRVTLEHGKLMTNEWMRWNIEWEVPIYRRTLEQYTVFNYLRQKQASNRRTSLLRSGVLRFKYWIVHLVIHQSSPIIRVGKIYPHFRLTKTMLWWRRWCPLLCAHRFCVVPTPLPDGIQWLIDTAEDGLILIRKRRVLAWSLWRPGRPDRLLVEQVAQTIHKRSAVAVEKCTAHMRNSFSE